MKKLIDTNVILRYLLEDHPQLSPEAKKVIESGAYTLPEVLAEVVYVLKGVYKVERKEISQTLIDFMDEVNVENPDVMIEAFILFAETSLDFVDCILIAYHRKNGVEIVSFDKKLNKNCWNKPLIFSFQKELPHWSDGSSSVTVWQFFSYLFFSYLSCF